MAVSNAQGHVRRHAPLIDRFRGNVRRSLSNVAEYLQAREGPYRGRYVTREAAESAASTAASRGRRIGYDHAEAAGMYLHELRYVRTSDYPVMYWLEKRLKSGFRIFDWGGNLGHSYYAYRQYLTYPTELTWTICDVPKIVAAGRELAERWGAPGLAFTVAPEDCEGYDVLLISGALQYFPGSLDAFLSERKRPPEAIIINRTPVHPTLGYFTLQDIGPAVCPYRVFVESELVATLADYGYALRDRWPCEGKSVRIPFDREATVERYTGFYFERRG